jgi:hypothetical protein
MESSQWKRVMEDFLDGIERQLPSSAPARTTLALNAFRLRLKAPRVAGGRKRFEQELEAFIDKNLAVRGAAERHLSTTMVRSVEAADVALRRADKILARARARMKL